MDGPGTKADQGPGTKAQGPMKRVVVALWLAATVVVWNVVFDRVLIRRGT